MAEWTGLEYVCEIHRVELGYDPDPEMQELSEWEEHLICPVEGCTDGAWVS